MKLRNLTTNQYKPTRTKESLQSKSSRRSYGSRLIIFLFLSLIPLYAQETIEEVETSFGEETGLEEVLGEEEFVEVLNAAARQRAEMEIRTSTLSELAAWCRTLGLSESGTRAELSERLRNHLALPEPDAANENRRVITIQSAHTTEYFTIDVIDEDYARLRGDVIISLTEDNATHRISANEVLFNRTRNIMTARGQVTYEKTSEDSIETFRGENITVNIDNWSGIFLDGNFTMAEGQTAYLFSGSVISRSDEDVTVLSGAIISNATNEDALWSINASRLWLLPGSDFAIFNGILKVGEIPVLYIPFFFFPGDRLFFHPVIGYRSREGGFVQTTSYIIGQPEVDPEQTSSLSRIMGSSDDMEKELDGLFLRSTGRRILNQDMLRLKALLDYYVNLGTYVGLELYVPRTGILNPLDFSIGIGFTRTIYEDGRFFSPFAPDFDGSVDQNYSNLFSMEVPFRYRMRLDSSVSARYFNLSWSFPYYSDPFVDGDFMHRSERMDWMNMIQQGIAVEEEVTSEEIRDYRWHVGSDINPSLPFLSPYVSRVSVSNLSSTLTFRTIRDADVWDNNPYAPERLFFAPDRFTIYNISALLSGTPLTIGGQQQGGSAAQERKDPLEGIGIPITPWQTNEEETGAELSDIILTPPVLVHAFTLPRDDNLRFSIDYQLSPNSSMELQFMNANWNAHEEIDWNEIQTILYNVGGNTNVNFRLDHTSGLFSNVVTFSGSGTFRDYSFLNEDAFLNDQGEVNQQRIDQLRRQQYSQTNYSTFYSYLGTLRPLYEDLIFGQSNLQYNFRGTLVRSRRWTVENSPDGPDLTPQWGSWVKEERVDGKDILGLTDHRFGTNLAANIMNHQQNISVSTDLPPLDGLVITNVTFRYWIAETNINFRNEQLSTLSAADAEKFPDKKEGDWVFRPVNFTQTFNFTNIGSFSYFMVIDPEEQNEITLVRSTLTLWSFRASYIADKSVKYKFVPEYPDRPYSGGEWKPDDGEPVLNPRELSFSYNRTTSSTEIIKDRLNLAFNVNTSLNFDLRQNTNSNFQFTFGFILGIPNLMELSLSATSLNSVVWRYFKGVEAFKHETRMYPEGPQNDVFRDLLDSFNFSDDSKRRRSGFKMQRFDLSLIRMLGDWKAEFDIAMYPYLPPGERPTIKAATDFSFFMQWAPITEIKTDVSFDGRNDRWMRNARN